MASIVVDGATASEEFGALAGVMQVRNQDHVADAAGDERYSQHQGDAEHDTLKAIERQTGNSHTNHLFQR